MSIATPDGLNSISDPPAEESLNGAWNTPPASFRSVLSANTITHSPASSVYAGNSNTFEALSFLASM